MVSPIVCSHAFTDASNSASVSHLKTLNFNILHSFHEPPLAYKAIELVKPKPMVGAFSTKGRKSDGWVRMPSTQRTIGARYPLVDHGESSSRTTSTSILHSVVALRVNANQRRAERASRKSMAHFGIS
jgi:hypothetical protein